MASSSSVRATSLSSYLIPSSVHVFAVHFAYLRAEASSLARNPTRTGAWPARDESRFTVATTSFLKGAATRAGSKVRQRGREACSDGVSGAAEAAISSRQTEESFVFVASPIICRDHGCKRSRRIGGHRAGLCGPYEPSCVGEVNVECYQPAELPLALVFMISLEKHMLAGDRADRPKTVLRCCSQNQNRTILLIDCLLRHLETKYNTLLIQWWRFHGVYGWP